MNNFSNLSLATGILENVHNTLKHHLGAQTKLMKGIIHHDYFDLQENAVAGTCRQSRSIRSDYKRSFRIKIPCFPKRPFGKPESFNNVELNFVEIDCKDKSHNLYSKQSKFFKLTSGRASSVNGRRERTKMSFRSPLRIFN